MKKIKLTQDKYALVDDDDFEKLNKFKWSLLRLKNHSYAIRNNNPIRLMHRAIMGIIDRGILVDHINHNGLDNRKINLRKCTPSENSFNRRKSKNQKSIYKGVVAHSRNFSAYISINKKRTYLGTFKTEHEAAGVYNEYARKYFGEFSCLNDVKKVDINEVEKIHIHYNARKIIIDDDYLIQQQKYLQKSKTKKNKLTANND